MISGSYEFNANLIVRAYYRHKTKEENYAEDGDNHTQVIPKITDRMLINLKYKIDHNFSIQTRVQHSKININNSNNSGFFIAQDLNYQRGRYSLSARFSLFDTDNYSNRQFIYERDLLYVYHIPSYYNRGIRYYMVGRIPLFRNVVGWIKLGQTHFLNQESIGSGLEEIDRDVKTTLSAQIRLRL